MSLCLTWMEIWTKSELLFNQSHLRKPPFILIEETPITTIFHATFMNIPSCMLLGFISCCMSWRWRDENILLHWQWILDIETKNMIFHCAWQVWCCFFFNPDLSFFSSQDFEEKPGRKFLDKFLLPLKRNYEISQNDIETEVKFEENQGSKFEKIMSKHETS